MKIAIEARALSHPQPGGFKSYTTNLIYGLLALQGLDEYLLYMDRAVPDSRLMNDSRVHIDYRAHPPSGLGVILREQVHLPASLGRSRPDLVHLPCGTGPCAGSAPMILTLHDVIEFLEPYDLSSISSEKLRRLMMKYYTRIIEKQLARKAIRIITDSDYSRMDITRLLLVDASKITAIPIAQGEAFRVIDDESRLRQAAEKFHLPVDFILAMSSSSPRKNVQGLLEGYARLPGGMRRSFPLVIIWTHQLHRETVAKLVDTYQLKGSVMFLPRVSDEELVLLYNLANLFIMPSLYEGFGLPVLEAMACGTPVICSNRTSLPEVAGDAAALVDPDQPESIASAFVDLIHDREKYRNLSQAGLKRAALFSWQHTARLTYQVYQEVYEQTRGSSR